MKTLRPGAQSKTMYVSEVRVPVELKMGAL